MTTLRTTAAGPILLIQPFWGADVTKALHCRMESLTLGYLASSLRRHGLEADVIDAQLLCIDEAETIRRATRKTYDIVGVSISAQRTYAVGVGVIRALRAAGVSAHIVVGGIFSTFAHDRLLEDVPEVDSVARGDGDLILVDLVRTIRSGSPLSNIRGLTYRDVGENGEAVVRVNPAAPPIHDLDALPYAARDDLASIIQEVHAGERMVGMLAGRGCEAKCSFCSIPAFVRELGRRFRSPLNVVLEMQALYDKWDVKHFRFYDDTLIGRGRKYYEWLEEFSDLLRARTPGVRFEAMGVRADGVSEDMFRKLHGAGLRRVFVGLDAGSAVRLRNYRKPQTISTGERTVQILRELDIEANFGFIMFQPTTTLEEIRHSFEFLKRIEDYKPHNLQNRYNLFYGVLVDERVTGEGLLKKTERLDSRRHYEFAHPDVKLMADLVEVIAQAMNDAHVLAANLELFLIEVRVALHAERPVLRNSTSSTIEDRSIHEVVGELDAAGREFARRIKSLWTRQFEFALALCERGTDEEAAKVAVARSSSEATTDLSDGIARISAMVLELAKRWYLGVGTRPAVILKLCDSRLGQPDRVGAGAPSVTRATSQWSTLDLPEQVAAVPEGYSNGRRMP